MIGRREIVFAAVATSFFYASATTFQSMGLVLFAMRRDFGWSEAATGSAFLALGLACCATGLAPVAALKRFGPRFTLVAGALVLALGFLVASQAQGLAATCLAAAIFGAGFPLAASVPGTYLIAAWHGKRSSGMIGLYLMAGTLGGAAGPPIAEGFLASSAGWRGYWLAMAGLGLLVALASALAVHEPPAAEDDRKGSASTQSGTWSYRESLRTPQFALLAATLVTSQMALITVSAVIASHFHHLGWAPGLAAGLLGGQALVATAATGLSGWLAERFEARHVHAGSLVALVVGLVSLAFARDVWWTYLFVLTFGAGWSAARVAVTVLLIRYFGPKSGTAALSTCWMLCGAAAAGPPAAGLAADLTGSFVPPLMALALGFLPLAAGALMIGAPRQKPAQGKEQDGVLPQNP